MKLKPIPAKFVAVEFEGRTVHASGLGITEQAAIRDAHKWTDVQAPLRVVPITKEAKEAVERLGGNGQKNKQVTLALVTKAELRALELLRKVAA